MSYTYSIKRNFLNKSKQIELKEVEILPDISILKSRSSSNSEKGSQYIAKRAWRNLFGAKHIKDSLPTYLKKVSVILFFLNMTTSIEHGQQLIRQGNVYLNNQPVYSDIVVPLFSKIELKSIITDSLINHSILNVIKTPPYLFKKNVREGILVSEPSLDTVQIPTFINKLSLERFRNK